MALADFLERVMSSRWRRSVLARGDAVSDFSKRCCAIGRFGWGYRAPWRGFDYRQRHSRTDFTEWVDPSGWGRAHFDANAMGEAKGSQLCHNKSSWRARLSNMGSHRHEVLIWACFRSKMADSGVSVVVLRCVG